jgi:ectoine hydroxylase-related dioxygenase (phytanoyl-CoA dioxygenase family)
MERYTTQLLELNLGSFVVRFPSEQPPGDDGWHIDSSFPARRHDAFQRRANVNTRGRALLMLFLLTDVTAQDAPTRLRVGPHHDVARILAPHGEDGLSMLAASQRAAEATADHPVALATGRPGDVYLCHPFLVHAAQAHRGRSPRIIAQPPLHPPGWTNTSFDAFAGTSSVKAAIRAALHDVPRHQEVR